jgi:hypothetical protein
MPKPAWYLTTSPEPDPEPLVGVLLAELTDRFTPPAGPTPADIAAALHLAVTAASLAGEAVTAGHLPTDPGDLARLVAGLNRLAAQATQTLQRLAYHADRRELADLADAPADLAADITTSLAHAGVYAELAAGHLREAELTLTKRTIAAPTA